MESSITTTFNNRNTAMLSGPAWKRGLRWFMVLLLDRLTSVIGGAFNGLEGVIMTR